jgi:hypothetical protein
MRRAVPLLVLGLALTGMAVAGDSAGCGLSKGLYEGWLGITKTAPRRGGGALIDNAPSAAEPDRRKSIAKEYHNYFRCISETAERSNANAVLEKCKEVEGDRPAWLACRTAAYLKGGRADGKEFLDVIPPGKKGAELIWDLDAIGGGPQDGSTGFFLPGGPAYKLLDELFLLVLDDKETAAAKYMGIATLAPGEAQQHVDEQLKLLLRESPAVVVKRWVIFRQYQAKLKKVVADLTANLPAAEMQRVRKNIGAFCSKDNQDCPEIGRLLGKLE